MDDEREPQKKTFCGVDLFILIYIFFHRFVSANHAKRKNRARTNLSPLFFTRGDDDDDARFFTPGSGC